MSQWTFSDSVFHNLEYFWGAVHALGYSRERLISQAAAAAKNYPGYRLAQLQRYHSQCAIPMEELICYDRYADVLFPDECTVFFAAGKASESGHTIFGKNSDKSGDAAFDSELFYRNRQINVVAYYDNPDGSHIVGVAAAGSTGLKMGLNSYGVAVGTNYGETVLAAQKAIDANQQLAGDRAQIARDALTEKTALQAAQKTAGLLMDHPMVSSGTLEFADAKDVYIIENAYQFIAIKHVTDDVDSRANFFNLLPQLNLEGNVSSFCRYHRSQELLKAEAGHVNLETMRRISIDHANGPGSSSICRHGTGMSSATLSAAIMELDGQNSKIHIALGTPCHAWASSKGHITISMDMPLNAVPLEFLNGETFRQFCLLEPLFG